VAYPHKWSPISYKSSAGQRKHIGQRPMLYRWTTQPTYCEPMSAASGRRLRSVSSSRLAVPRTRTNYGDRSFAVYGPRVWNSLPDELRSHHSDYV